MSRVRRRRLAYGSGSTSDPTCAGYRELISANLDSETTDDECLVLADHLAECRQCREFASAASMMHRSWRVGPAPGVPDLTDSILTRAFPDELDEAAAPEPSCRPPQHRLVRAGLALLGLGQLAVALPDMVRHHDTSEPLMALRHLDAWAVAFAVGLLVVAVQPWRARGLLPLATALGAGMAFTIGLDMVNEHAIPMPTTAHVVEAGGLLLLWVLARAHRRAEAPSPSSQPGPRNGRRREEEPVEDGTVRRNLRLVKRDPDAA